ncbi:MAG: histidine kinase dimerization/phospho-acceptor domain-containing protein, partial [Propionivibrio sp.]
MPRKFFGYPRSFLRFILLSYALVCLPLLVTAFYSVTTMNTLSRQNSRTVQNASLISQISGRLAGRLTEMERGLRQYAVLDDPALLAEYRRNGREFAELLRQLAALHPAQGLEAPLYPLIEQAIAIIEDPPDRLASDIKASTENALQILEQLGDSLPGIVKQSEQEINEKIVSNQTLADSTQTSLLVSLFVSILVAALIVLMFRRLIDGQMRQFERAVRTLGAGHYIDAIHFSGPEDIRFIGEQLEWLRVRLKELEAQRHRFLRNVSHGLKTPLTVLREGAQLLADGISGPLSRQQLGIVNIMKDNSSRLQRMIEDLLRAQQASLAIAGISPHAVRFDLICKQVIKDQQLQAEKRQINVASDLPEVTLEGVTDQLQKVVDNLISNAIKFTPDDGEIRLS